MKRFLLVFFLIGVVFLSGCKNISWRIDDDASVVSEGKPGYLVGSIAFRHAGAKERRFNSWWVSTMLYIQDEDGNSVGVIDARKAKDPHLREEDRFWINLFYIPLKPGTYSIHKLRAAYYRSAIGDYRAFTHSYDPPLQFEIKEDDLTYIGEFRVKSRMNAMRPRNFRTFHTNKSERDVVLLEDHYGVNDRLTYYFNEAVE